MAYQAIERRVQMVDSRSAVLCASSCAGLILKRVCPVALMIRIVQNGDHCVKQDAFSDRSHHCINYHTPTTPLTLQKSITTMFCKQLRHILLQLLLINSVFCAPKASSGKTCALGNNRKEDI
jgi:hypothetical protein